MSCRVVAGQMPVILLAHAWLVLLVGIGTAVVWCEALLNGRRLDWVDLGLAGVCAYLGNELRRGRRDALDQILKFYVFMVLLWVACQVLTDIPRGAWVAETLWCGLWIPYLWYCRLHLSWTSGGDTESVT